MRSPRFRAHCASLTAALALVPAASLAQTAGVDTERPPGAVTPAPVRTPATHPVDPTASTATVSTNVGATAESEGVQLRLTLPGEWQVRAVALSPIPLVTTPGESTPRTLGQESYVEMWFRFNPEAQLGSSLRLVSQFDIARGILVGDSTRQVELSRDSRSTQLSPFPYGAFDLRWAFLEWRSPIGIIRAGQMGSHWGLGIVANDGTRAPVFGDYRMGDIVERIALATRPLGSSSDAVVAIAGDLVYRDRITSLLQYEVPIERGDLAPGATPPTRILGGDRALQGVVSIFYQDHNCARECERKRIGVYAAYRDHRNLAGDTLNILVADFHARWEWPTPDGSANIFAGVELAGIFGTTTITQNIYFASHAVQQFGGALEVGIERRQRFKFTLAAGYASGDSNPVDGAQRRFTFNPSYRVGLIMFPEMLNWVTARSASIAVDDRILGRPTRGADLLPTSGGVANAAYLYPTAIIEAARWLDVRAGAVVGVSTSDFVDPVQVQVYGAPRNYRGGDGRARDLGLELDLGLIAKAPLGGGIFVSGGVEGGVMFPGRAFDNDDPDPSRRALGALWLVRARAGLSF